MFDLEHVQCKLGQLPTWLLAFQAEGGLESFEREQGVMVPAALREFWTTPELVSLWDHSGMECLDEPPTVVTWKTDRYLVFDLHGHSVSVGAALLNGEHDPPVCYGWIAGSEAETPGGWVAQRFSEYIENGLRNRWMRCERQSC